MIITQLEKRVNQLEQAERHLDPLRACLAVLDDQQLECLLEFSELRDSGFDGPTIELMMANRFAVVQEAKRLMEKRYQELTGKPKPSRSRRIAEAP